MGSRPNLPQSPGGNPTPEQQFSYQFQLAMRDFQRGNSVTTSGLVELLGFEDYKINPWFLRGKRNKLPSGVEALVAYTQLDLVHGAQLLPTGRHGRRFNYVRLFEGKPLTDYEETLEKSLEQALKIVDDLKVANNFLRQELGLPKKN